MVALVGIDPRSLALFRMALGTMLLLDLGNRALDLEAHYTDAGVMPVRLLYDAYWWDGHHSLHALSGGMALQVALFALAFLFAAALAVGWHTRLATLGSWLLLCSLHARNPAILQGGDDLLRLLVFWSLFLPLGEMWSVDGRRAHEEQTPRLVVSVATLGLLLQVCYVYWFSIPLKSHPSWWAHGTAVWFALITDPYATTFGRALGDVLGVAGTRPLTWASLVVEAAGPLLAWSPWRTGPLRTAAVFVMIGFHVMLGSMLAIGLFAMTSCVSWLVFLPPWFWDRLPRVPALDGDRLRRSRRGVEAAALGALLYVTMWCARGVMPQQLSPWFPPDTVNIVGRTLRLEQYWNMFASPIRQDGWVVVPAELRDGSSVDLWTGLPVTWARPDPVYRHYRRQRWRKFLFNTYKDNNVALRGTWANWLARRWDRTHDPAQHVRAVRVVKMATLNTLEGEGEATQKELWRGSFP